MRFELRCIWAAERHSHMALAARRAAHTAGLRGASSAYSRQASHSLATITLPAVVTVLQVQRLAELYQHHGFGVRMQSPRYWQRHSRCVVVHSAPHEPDPHIVLGVSRSASRADIRAAYYARLQEVRTRVLLIGELKDVREASCAHSAGGAIAPSDNITYRVCCIQVHPDVSGTDTTLEAVQLNLAYARLIGVSNLIDCAGTLRSLQASSFSCANQLHECAALCIMPPTLLSLPCCRRCGHGHAMRRRMAICPASLMLRMGSLIAYSSTPSRAASPRCSGASCRWAWCHRFWVRGC